MTETEASTDGSVPITVEVSVSSVTGGSSSGSVATSSSQVAGWVHPVCWYEPTRTGAEMATYLDGDADHDSFVIDGNIQEWRDLYAGYEDHATEDGSWWTGVCSSAYAADMASFLEADRAFWASYSPVWVPAGQSGPVPVIDGATLASAAWAAVSVPAPTIDYNPKLQGGSGTVVGMDTWVWATGETPSSVTASASTGGASVTVTAASSGLTLSAPDAEVDCHGFGVPWSAQADTVGTDCSVLFTRSSAHLGGTTPLDVSAVYTVSWTASDGSGGDLGSVTTAHTVDLPVAEIQTVVTSG